MGDSEVDTGPFGVSEPLSPRPSIEIIERWDEWVVEEYDGGHRDGETYATYERRIDAIRGAKSRMDDDGHPCLLKWDAEDIVGNIYWNPLFEELELRYDRLLEAWAVVPAESHYLFGTASTLDDALDAARLMQRRYDFKHLDVYTRDGTHRKRIDHRFIRQSLAKSGVRFEKRDRSGAATDAAAIGGLGWDDEEASADDEAAPESMPASALVAAVSDLTEVTVESTEGPIHRYLATWTDGEPATVAALAPEYSSHNAAVDAFTNVTEAWASMADSTHVTTVFDTGIGPSPWVAYRASDVDFAAYGDELSIGTQLRVCREIAIGQEVARRSGMAGIGVAPGNVCVVDENDTKRITLSNWGLHWQVSRALHADRVTPYTAPEQLDGSVTTTTGVYQLGAFAYRLLTGTAPFTEATDLKTAIHEESPAPPSRRGRVPNAVDDVLSRAMAADPSGRFDGVDDLYGALLGVFQ
jgi:hypothetical protein